MNKRPLQKISGPTIFCVRISVFRDRPDSSEDDDDDAEVTWSMSSVSKKQNKCISPSYKLVVSDNTYILTSGFSSSLSWVVDSRGRPVLDSGLVLGDWGHYGRG